MGNRGAEWGEWGNGGRSAGNQVENMENRGGNAANNCKDVGNAGKNERIWGIGVAMQGIRLEMQGKWGKNKDVWIEIDIQVVEKGKNHRKYFSLQLPFM